MSTVRLSLIIIIFCIIALPLYQSIAGEHSDSRTPPWPFARLTAEERMARIDFFTDKQVFNLHSATNARVCDAALEKIKSHDYEVLKPYGIYKADDPAVASAQKRCPAIDLTHAWFSVNNGPMNPGDNASFDMLSDDQKEKISDFYYKEDGEIELYDLTTFFGDTVTGTFSESGTVKCNDSGDALCKNLLGYRKFAGTVLSNVFKEPSCTLIAGVRSPAQSRLKVSSSRPFQYSETPNVYAFIREGDQLFRIAINTIYPWSKFGQVSQRNDTTQLILEPLNAQSRDVCIYHSNIE